PADPLSAPSFPTRRSSDLVIRERNDVGAEAFPRRGIKTMSGQRRFPDMARNRCRASSVSPTWHETDVGPEVFSRHGTKPMSGQRDRKSTRLNSSHVSISYA